ncbi:response regulator [Caballeronia sp. LP006]|uniref:response regulator n=1 Tax=Caballeronia sp. LP006 TaxID=3038552 RepID=UPI002861D36C|nr:response regulator [Caballeronia sp. LP006]MDR5826356.1 response regulator [Caballeronia sp. LP006]
MSAIKPQASYPYRWTDRAICVKRRHPRILIVDDNTNAAEALAAYLDGGPFKVLAVYGGAAAIAAACIWKPDALLLDISMPVIDGFSVARALRQNAKTSSMVIVALTAHDDAFVKQRASEGDFDGYCQKGLMLQSLMALLHSFIESANCLGLG